MLTLENLQYEYTSPLKLSPDKNKTKLNACLKVMIDKNSKLIKPIKPYLKSQGNSKNIWNLPYEHFTSQTFWTQTIKKT